MLLLLKVKVGTNLPLTLKCKMGWVKIVNFLARQNPLCYNIKNNTVSSRTIMRERSNRRKGYIMNLLVIGNGFDLAHHLPTRYTDFLKYCKNYNGENPISKEDDKNKEFDDFRQNNVWLKYFLSITNLEDDKTWIDFEKEIAKIVNAAESNTSAIFINKISAEETQISIRHAPDELKNFFLTFEKQHLEKGIDGRFLKIILNIKGIDCLTSFIDYLYRELRNFARAFEIYCLHVNKIEIITPVVSCSIKNELEQTQKERDHYRRLERQASGYMNRKREENEYKEKAAEAARKYSQANSQIRKRDYLSLSKFDCVLSFNYTNTYERLYGNEKTQYCYIHGKAQNDRTKTNLILGIDDNLKQGLENQNFEWAKFKKYYQRIILKTGSEYKDWLSPSSNNSNGDNYVYIVGHSLDQTDFDVLYEIFTNSSFKIIVYYYNQKDFEEKVQKVIKLLSYKGMSGRDELIKRVHGNKWSIKFVDQYDCK